MAPPPHPRRMPWKLARREPCHADRTEPFKMLPNTNAGARAPFLGTAGTARGRPGIRLEDCDRHNFTFTDRTSYPAGMDDLLDALQALRPLWPRYSG